MTVLVTGSGGFIGFHLCKRLLDQKVNVIGLDNLNPYYDPFLKEERIKILNKASQNNNCQFTFYKNNLEDNNKLEIVFNKHKIKNVVNLAAQAGVRYSIENPSAYIQSNLVGFGNILECSRNHEVKHLVYASSSSVYGGNKSIPFSEHHGVDHPVSLYAASKKANELMAHTYSHLYNLPTTGLRFFTVYGPWGRPDMALFLFTKAIIEGKPIKIFNNGKMIRDFTYIDDVVESILRVISKPATPNLDFDNTDPSSSWAPYRIFNIGNSNPINLMDYIKAIERKTGLTAQKVFTEMQPGDVKATFANTKELENWIDFKPNTNIEDGVSLFVDWYREFYKI